MALVSRFFTSSSVLERSAPAPTVGPAVTTRSSASRLTPWRPRKAFAYMIVCAHGYGEGEDEGRGEDEGQGESEGLDEKEVGSGEGKDE